VLVGIVLTLRGKVYIFGLGSPLETIPSSQTLYLLISITQTFILTDTQYTRGETMTQYLCHSCGVKTHLKRHLDSASGVPSAESCPNCGESDEFEYL
jgi:DNA-directed RNA polymerase subunit RPC12/RpoP